MGMVNQIRTAAAQALQPQTKPDAKPGGPSGEFRRILQAQLSGQRISISAHAADRMVRRGITPSAETLAQLNTAFEMAERKGAREALFLLDDMAIVASVPDRTVKTALDRQAMDAGVFTQIDAAVVLTGRTPVLNENQSTVNLSPRSSGWAPSGEATIQPGGSSP